MLYKTYHTTPAGKLTLISDGKALKGLWLEKQKHFNKTITEPIPENSKLKIFQDTKKWLDRYFQKEKPQISELQLDPTGNDFQKLVWKALQEIPYGQVTTYGNIAKQIAKLKGISIMSAQAVGGAIAHNPISIIIPCHRVIGTKGNLTGYAGGIDVKIKLLKLENVDMTKMFYSGSSGATKIDINSADGKLLKNILKL